MNRFFRTAKLIVLGILGIAVTWKAITVINGLLLLSTIVPSEEDSQRPDSLYHTVQVLGQVANPGHYRVRRGTSNFELLHKAGITPSSDVRGLHLGAVIDSDRIIRVQETQTPVSTASQGNTIRLEFFTGSVELVSKDGRSMQPQPGIAVEEGTRIITDAAAQAELSINAVSRVDIDELSELTVEKINEEVDGSRVTQFFQRSGIGWYDVSYQNDRQQVRITTRYADIIVAQQGANFTVDASYDNITVHTIDGLLLVERENTDEAINLISGQQVTVYADERPFQVRSATPEKTPNEIFSPLSRKKTEYYLKTRPLNFMFYGIPASYYLISADFDRRVAIALHIPPRASVDRFATGVSTVEQALLKAGPAFTTTILEELMNTRIQNYILVTRLDVLRIARVLGPVRVQVDAKAASGLNIAAGAQQLRPDQLFNFLQPSLSGMEASYQRQKRVMHSLFTSLSTGEIVLKGMLIKQLLAETESNFNWKNVTDKYQQFRNQTNWSFSYHQLPVSPTVREDGTHLIPDVENARTLLTPEG